MFNTTNLSKPLLEIENQTWSLALSSKGEYFAGGLWNEQFDRVISVYGLTVGIPSEKEKDNILYPNPSSGKLIIPLENVSIPEVKVVISDVNGKVLFSDNVKLEENKVVFDVSRYSKGSYVLVLDYGSTYKTYNFIKE